ncbi:MAG: hypothetical protein GQ565_07215 [Candidatus Aegiribacteria sp.]|nr:hypothetical protein [Candidatus Aegiribacteria sp.]
MQNEVSLVIFGDICSDRGFRQIFSKGNSEELFGFAEQIVSDSDIAIANLECPLTDSLEPIRKSGPCLSGPPETAIVLARAGFDAVCLANNHIMDQGEDGLRSTINVCDEAGLEIVGAGENLQEARQPLIIERNGVRVGFYCMAETEFSIASDSSAGANGIDAASWVNDITGLKVRSDFIVVLLHSGKENYQLPTPLQQQLCRNLVRNGADLIVCQHSHCIGAYEKYQNKVIIYGQGNFIFDSVGPTIDTWHIGVIARICINSDRSCKFDPVYYYQSTRQPSIRALTESEMREVTERQISLNKTVVDPESVKNEWNIIVGRDAPNMLYLLSGYRGLLLRILRRLGLHKLLYKNTTRLSALNMLRCQTHRELLETYFENE